MIASKGLNPQILTRMALFRTDGLSGVIIQGWAFKLLQRNAINGSKMDLNCKEQGPHIV